ncbi:MAG: hypothetical protein NT075_21705, partial [Chloroflexi bacterium]|nr:hypothetical protein [Chloroflexota bacterium]
MKTLTMEVEIAIDGRLRLDIFSGLPPGQAEVVLVIQPSTQRKFQQGIQQSVTQQTNSDLQHLAEITSASAYDVDSIANLSEK